MQDNASVPRPSQALYVHPRPIAPIIGGISPLTRLYHKVRKGLVNPTLFKLEEGAVALLVVLPLLSSVLLIELHWRKVQADCLASIPNWRVFYTQGRMLEEIEALAHELESRL